jgi:hypothetical protein
LFLKQMDMGKTSDEDRKKMGKTSDALGIVE